MSGNFVNIVGYQFERVHTGVISWILNSNNSIVSINQKYEALRKLYRMCKQPIPFKKLDISTISCLPEFSFGRKRKIDLVVKIDLVNQHSKYLVIEMKVDSIPYSEQLVGSIDDFIRVNNCEPEDVLFLLFMFGSAQVCIQPNLHSFIAFRVPEILEVFFGLHIDHHIYKDWIESLKQEDVRGACINSDLIDAPGIWTEEYWKDKGHRLWFPLFYYIYHELKQYSKYCDSWNIYSGSNNPIMNWRNGWLEKSIAVHQVKFYWEFNYEELVLKVLLGEIEKLPKSDLKLLREKIAIICDQETNRSGRRTKNSYGTYNSIYKWKYDFKGQGFKEIMEEVDTILDKVHPYLQQL